MLESLSQTGWGKLLMIIVVLVVVFIPLKKLWGIWWNNEED